MSPRAWRWAAAALAAVYFVWGVMGTRAGWASYRGAREAAANHPGIALPLLDRAAFGSDAAEVSWLAGEVALALADAARDPGDRMRWLDLAADRYLHALRLAAGSAYAWAGLAATELRLEQGEKATWTIDLTALAASAWAAVGRHGRLAIGMLRVGVAREPSTCAAHDALVNTLVSLGLMREARAAALAAAGAAPALEYHDGLDPAALPRDVLEAFAEGSRAALDGAPLATRERKLFYLGLLDERLGRIDAAVKDLEAAHAVPAGVLEHAETAFHLGRLLARTGRGDEAEIRWQEAAASEVFRASVAIERAKLEEAEGRTHDALLHLADARRHAPRRLDLILWEARLLLADGRAPEAVETYRWGVLVYPDNRAAHAGLVEALLAAGERTEARQALDEFERGPGAGDDTRALRERIEAAARGAP